MSKSKVAVVILNWNGLNFLQKFLGNVVECSPEAEVIVVDNASTDASIEYLQQNFPNVKIIRFNENHGFCGGYNKALAQIEAEYFVLLNSDVEVSKNWLLPLIQELDHNPETAVVQPKMKSYADKSHFEYAGAAGGYIDKFGYPFCRGRLFDELEKDEGQFDINQEIFWASGAAFMIRSNLYLKMGGLDENFFAHMEEIDLCWRLLNEGYKIKCISNSEVFHVGGGTLPKSNPRKTYLNHRNGLFLIYKNLSPEKRTYRIFMRLILDGLSAGMYLLKGKFGDFSAVLKSHRDFYKMKKNLVQSKKFKKEDDLEGFYPKSILLDYFILGKKKFRELRWN